MATLPLATQPLPAAPDPPAPNDMVNLRRLALGQPSTANVHFGVSGPSLNPFLPPWSRPQLPADPPWPGRPLNYSLPLRVLPLPSEATEWQQHINEYLDRVATAYPIGLVVVRRELSERTAGSRTHNVQHTRFRPPQGGPAQPYVLASTTHTAVLNGPVGAVWPAMLLSDYAGLHRVVAETYRRDRAQLALLTSPVHGAPNSWHQVTLLILDYRRHPIDGDFRQIYIYDPQHAGPNHPVGAPRMLRLHDRTASHLSILRDLFGHFRGTKGWGMSTAGEVASGTPSEAWIGGGGSGGPVAECRRMACTWLQQTAALVEAERRAVDAHNAAGTPANAAAVAQARTERLRWLQHFIPLVR